MATQQRVRSHTRRTPSGDTTTVRQHARHGRPRRGGVTPRHAWKLARRAFGAARKRKRATAVIFGALALGEMAAWLTLTGVGLMLAVAGGLALAVAAVAGLLTGVDL